MIPCQRDRFSVPPGRTYLNCAYMGPLPNVSAQAAREAIARKQHSWEVGAQDFFDVPERGRSAFARIIGADADNIAIVPAVSYGVSLAARNIPLKKGKRILLLAEEFPSSVYAWRRAAEKSGAIIDTVPYPQDGDWTGALLSAIDETAGVVCVPHCHWTDGSRVDLVKIGAACREAGAALVVDGIQSFGAMPFSVKEIQPDFAVCGTYKWLLGPYAYGFCYIAPKWRGAEPLEENWINREGSEAFSQLTRYRDGYQPGARKFDMGERAGFGLAEPAAASLELLLEWGVENIADYTRALTREALRLAQTAGYGTFAEAMYAPHMVGITLEAPVSGLAAALAEHGVHVSVRGNKLRISPHLYNTSEDIHTLFRVLKEAL